MNTLTKTIWDNRYYLIIIKRHRTATQETFSVVLPKSDEFMDLSYTINLQLGRRPRKDGYISAGGRTTPTNLLKEYLAILKNRFNVTGHIPSEFEIL